MAEPLAAQPRPGAECLVLWLLLKACSLTCHMVCRLKQYHKVWNILLWEPGKIIKLCAFFFVIGDIRYNSLSFTLEGALWHTSNLWIPKFCSSGRQNKGTDLSITDLTCWVFCFLWNLASLIPKSWSWSLCALCLQKMKHFSFWTTKEAWCFSHLSFSCLLTPCKFSLFFFRLSVTCRNSHLIPLPL